MLFQLYRSIGYFMEMLLGGFKSHKPLHQLSQKQFNKIADHSCLMVGQGQSCCFVGSNKERYRHAQKISTYFFLTCWAPARNTIVRLFKTSEEEKNHLHTLNVSLLKLWKHCVWQSSTALPNQQGRQLTSMKCLSAQCKEYFKWIWKCSYTKISVVHKFSDNKERWLQFTACADWKD